MNDETYMKLALKLAGKGQGLVAPNPMVGAVIVKNDKIIGTGYHARYGQAHAERNALSNCTESPQGSTMYVTLEPCCHQGKQPPCTRAILDAGITRVVIGTLDPNPLVSGKGIQILKEHGILITEGVLENECLKQNEVFFHFVSTKQPFIVMKYAMTMDGKTASYTGASKWITGEEARQHVHEQRSRYTAIMTGIGTVLADDPLLTCRNRENCNPIRIICDTKLQLPLSSQIVQTARQVRTIIATCSQDIGLHNVLISAGCEILTLPEKKGHIDLTSLMALLGEMNIDSILVEGGSTLNWSFIENRLVNKVLAYIAPKLLGGKGAYSPISGAGFSLPSDAIPLKNSTVTQLGKDFLIESEVE